jgi:hypothetical protein
MGSKQWHWQMLGRHDRHFLWLIGFIATCAGLVIAASRLL